MYKRIIKYIDKHDVLFHSQYGFRKKDSIILAIFEFVAKLLPSIDNNNY